MKKHKDFFRKHDVFALIYTDGFSPYRSTRLSR